MHGSTCAPHKDDQFDCPSCIFSFCLFCYCVVAFDYDIMLSPCPTLSLLTVIMSLIRSALELQNIHSLAGPFNCDRVRTPSPKDNLIVGVCFIPITYSVIILFLSLLDMRGCRGGRETRQARHLALCFFVLCNRQWFNRVPGAHLGIACLPSALTLTLAVPTYP